MGNPSTIDVPVFDSKPDWDQVNSHEGDLHAEMLYFTDEHKNSTKSVSILHASTDLESAQDAVNRLVSLMRETGFDCQRDDGIDTYRYSDVGVDMTIVGCDKRRHNDAIYFIQQRMARGFLSIAPELDVLWYGTDYLPRPPAGIGTLCSDRNFSVEAACMIRAHSRRRDNIETQRGSCISMMVRIENIIDGMLDTWDKNARTKIRLFENKVKKDGRWGLEAKLFFAALAVIRDARNAAAHPGDHVPPKMQQKKKKISKRLMNNFNSLANMYGRHYLKFEHDTSAPNMDYKRLKWMNGLAQVAVTWIDNYRKKCAQRP